MVEVRGDGQWIVEDCRLETTVGGKGYVSNTRFMSPKRRY